MCLKKFFSSFTVAILVFSVLFCTGFRHETAQAAETAAAVSTETVNTETAGTETAETEITEEDTDTETTEELTENSWRYSDGEWITDSTLYSFSSTYANAWNKVNGVYMNSEGEVISGAKKKGIDVSKWQGEIDWEKVQAAGIEFAIIRCGYGSNNSAYDDTYWEYNVSECERLGIDYGVYLYSYATDTLGAASEAQHVLRLLDGHEPTYPVYLDMEDDSTVSAGSDMLGSIAQTFCDTVSAAGYDVGIYANKNWWTNYLTDSAFNNSSWSKWVAQYNSNCTYTGDYDMWQCTSTGTVNGIDEYVDIDFWMTETDDADPVEVEDEDIISYRSHMQTFGWLSWVQNGYQSGYTIYSKRMEAIQIQIEDDYEDLGVRYSTCIQGDIWQDYVSDGDTAGTVGESKYVEAIKIELTGDDAADYDIYYRVYTSTYGWLGWAKNGAAAGTYKLGKQMEAIQIVVQSAGSAAPGSTSNAYREKPTGTDTLAVRRDNIYYFKYTLDAGDADLVLAYGKTTDEVYIGDWDGDGVDTLCVRRGNVYYFKNSLAGGSADVVIAYGKSTDEVLVGDWNGDGTDTLCVRRGNTYYIKNSLGGGNADQVLYYGKATDTVLAGDWEGDGADTLCVRRGNTYYIKNSLNSGNADQTIYYGKATDEVLVGDWDGDGTDTLCVRRGNFYHFKNTISTGTADSVVAYGKASDVVYAGKW